MLPLFVVRPELMAKVGEHRRLYLAQSLQALDESLGGNLPVVDGGPCEVMPRISYANDDAGVHIAVEYSPYGCKHDEIIESAGVQLVCTGSPYAVAPGRVLRNNGTNYRVYTPLYKAWVDHGRSAPVGVARSG